MKKALCVVLVTLVVGLAGMPVKAKLQPAFRDLVWGMSSEVLGERGETTSAVSTNPYNLRYYVKKNEDLQLGPIKAEIIIYGFWNDKLSTILVYTKDSADALELLSLHWAFWAPYMAVSWHKPLVDNEEKIAYYILPTDTYCTAYKRIGLLELQGAKMWDRIARSTPPPF